MSLNKNGAGLSLPGLCHGQNSHGVSEKMFSHFFDRFFTIMQQPKLDEPITPINIKYSDKHLVFFRDRRVCFHTGNQILKCQRKGSFHKLRMATDIQTIKDSFVIADILEKLQVIVPDSFNRVPLLKDVLMKFFNILLIEIIKEFGNGTEVCIKGRTVDGCFLAQHFYRYLIQGSGRKQME